MRSLVFLALFVPAIFVPSIALAEAPNPQIDRLWRAKCSSCHGPDGKGATEQGKKMAVEDMTSPAWQAITDDKIKASVNDGLKREKGGVHQEMEAYKSKLRPEQVDGLVTYIRALKK
ncbi:MAG: cytochrome c class [Myxococcales bacterium]|nr:cytochrome c class [Myxococcales bacterium]